MKKLVLILVSITLLTSCNDEPLGPGVIQSNNEIVDPTFALSTYTFDLNTALPGFGNIIVNSDFEFNSNNAVDSLDVFSSFLGFNSEVRTGFVRNVAEKITAFNSIDDNGTITNTTTIAYDGNQITQISYDFLEDDEDDYTYNFTRNNNVITGTEVGSTMTVEFTLDNSGRVISKEAFEDGNSIFLEVITYAANGNVTMSTVTGEENSTVTYGYDNLTNPLKSAFLDQRQLSYLNDDFDSPYGTYAAQFYSENNWTSITTEGETVDFTVEYDPLERIITRNATYDFGDGVLIIQNESFGYAN